MVNNTAGSGTGTGTVTVKNGASLSGTGIISGSVTIEDGGALVPGNKGIGTFKVNNQVTFMPGSYVAIELNSSSKAGDLLEVSGQLTLAGTLYITNPGPELFAAGDSFRIFNATSCSGSFSSILPVSPGSGLIWDTTKLRLNGILQVANINMLSENELRSGILIYPNPLKNSLSLKPAWNVADFRLELENLNGQIVFAEQKQNVSEYELNLSHFSPGIYILRLILDSQIFVNRLIKE